MFRSLILLFARGNQTLTALENCSAGYLKPSFRQEIAPGKNRLLYIWGHLTAVNDALLPLLGVGEKLHPELDPMFLSNPDRSQQKILSGEELKRVWDEINRSLWSAFSKWTPSEWLQNIPRSPMRISSKEPHRNRFTILLGRTSHLAYHLGQANLVV